MKKDKVIGAFKGVLKSYTLLPLSSKPSDSTGYINCYLPPFNTDTGKKLELYVEQRKLSLLLEKVEELYPGKVNRNQVIDHLISILNDWVLNNRNFRNQTLVEKRANDFLEQISSDIKTQTIYVPIVGLKTSVINLRIGEGVLYENRDDCELIQAIDGFIKRHPSDPHDYLLSYKEALAYLEFTLSGHQKRIIQEVKIKAEFSLAILRLLIASYYKDIVSAHPRPKIMGLLGTVPQGEFEHMLLKQDDTHINLPRRIYVSDNFQFHRVTRKAIEIHLSKINTLLEKPSEESFKRLRLAINWFAKATTANSITESFLMYAIAIESILSEGRTPKETYGERIAFLTKPQGNDSNLFPMGGELSDEFNKKLLDNTLDPLQVIKDRTIKLFKVRNNIAHGKIDIEQNISRRDLTKYTNSLIDFETLVRNAILAFVHGGWLTLEDFKRHIREIN